MKHLILTFALLGICTASTAQEGPTMGWSSWNTYGVNINEQLIKRQANAMVSKGLKDVGFDHVNIDDGYFGGRNKETGQLLIHPTRFPNGLQGVVDHIHSKGLKAGIYSDAGRNTCGSMFNGDAIGKGVGLYEHDQQDADFFFKELGFDFIKVDFCGGSYYHNEDHLVLDEKARYEAIAQAIRNTGRTDVRMNACRWAYPGTWIDGAAFSWRTTGDIYDGWNSVKGILAENLYMSAYCSKGHYNDMDMLEVGRSMTAEEDKTHFGLWCIMNSPLLIGCDLTTIKSATLTLLKNKELIALNQDTLYQQAYVAACTDSCFVLVKDIEVLQGKKRAFAVYNPGDKQKKVTVSFASIDLGGSVKLRDVFAKRDLGVFTDGYEVTLPAHGTRIYVAEAEQRLERTLYEAEAAFISDYQEIKNNQAEKTGIYEANASCSGGYKAGWLGYSEQNDLQWRDVYSVRGGKYTLTIGLISGESRSITVSVNGKKVKTLNASSGDWGKVGTTKLTIELQPGRNTVRLSNATGWMPDIDYIKLAPYFEKVNQSVNINVNGETRSYCIYAPASRKLNAPVVFALHGARGQSTQHSPNFDTIADKDGCIVVYPQGKMIYFPVFGGTVTGWDASGEANGDVDFIKAVIEDVAANYSIDRQRIYCCGFSNGGMMTYALTNTCSDVFAAFASISGFPLNEFHFRHTGWRPVPFLHIHGKQDDFVKYSLMPVIVDEMLARTGANPVPEKTTVSGKYDKSVYEAAEGSFPYIYYEVDGMGHNDFTANMENSSSSMTMWNFFQQYKLNIPCDTMLRWSPRIETEGFVPKNHGWTVNSGKTLLSFGLGNKTDANQNVYHSLQLKTGHYKLCFKSTGEEGKTIGVKLQRFKTANVVLQTTVSVGGQATLYFTIDNDEWGEYKLTLTREQATDDIAISNLAIYSASDDEISAVPAIHRGMAADDHAYTLSGIGRSASGLSKAVYIQNGKKILK